MRWYSWNTVCDGIMFDLYPVLAHLIGFVCKTLPSTASDKSCCTTVLLTERCHAQSVMLKRLLERTGQSLPPALEKMAQDVLKVCLLVVCWGAFPESHSRISCECFSYSYRCNLCLAHDKSCKCLMQVCLFFPTFLGRWGRGWGEAIPLFIFMCALSLCCSDDKIGNA